MTAKKKFFEAELKVLIKEFEDGWTDTESDASIGAAMLEFIFRYVRLQHGVLNQPERWPELDIDTLHKLFSWDRSAQKVWEILMNVASE